MYAGQSLGLIVANTRDQAINAAKLVKVSYKNLQKPVLTIKEALKDPKRVKVHAVSGSRKVINVGNVEGTLQSFFYCTM